jgi:hypothetical protein
VAPKPSKPIIVDGDDGPKVTKRVTVDRPISSEEIAVIQVMLERAAVSPEYLRLNTNLSSLRVVERCACGCDSVDFTTYDPQSPSRRVAHGSGTTPSGNPVGVIIWGSASSVAGIEVYASTGTEEDLLLPTAESIRAW